MAGARRRQQRITLNFEEYGIVLLVYVYDKHQKDNLTDAEKKVIRDYIRREKKALDRRQTI